MIETFKALTPEQRKQKLDEMPEEWRGRVRDLLNANGIPVKE